MSLYPSLEDMKVDRMMQAQYQSQNISPVQNPSAPSLPYPIAPNNAGLYPSLSEYMGLELTPAVLAANMPEYAATNQVAVPDYSIGGLIAPLSGGNRGLQRAHVTNGIREMSLCKDGSGKIGIKAVAINNGIFVSHIQKDSTAAKAGLRFGDQIIQVQGKDVAAFTADAVHSMIKKGPDSGLNLVVRDRPFERTVTLHKDSVGHIGFSFQKGKIIALVKDSSAARNGLLTEHQLLEVNGQNVIGLTDKEISKVISEAGQIVTVTIIPFFIYGHMVKNMGSGLFSTMDHSTW